MIPLPIFLVVWLILLLAFSVMALVSVVQMLRFGIAGTMAYISTAGFLILSFFVIAGTGLYLLNVDWSLSLDLTKIFAAPVISL